MIEIKDLLLRFNNILLREEVKAEAVRDAVSEVLGIQIKKEEVIIKNNIVFLNIKPIYKSEIFLKREQILSKLKNSFGEKVSVNIR